MPQSVILKTALTLPPVASLWDGPTAKNQDTETLGHRIAQLRREKGLTQAELAQQLEVSQPAVSDYKNDVIYLPVDMVAQIAGILGASTDELLGMKTPSCTHQRRQHQEPPPPPAMQELEKLRCRDREALPRTIAAFISKMA
jgi:transcriptional regulator with XRE-family HTH domain